MVELVNPILLNVLWAFWVCVFFALIVAFLVLLLLDEYAKKKYVLTLDEHDAKVISDYRAVSFRRRKK